MATSSWTVLDEEAGILTCEYTFAPNSTARTVVARTDTGELVVVSPASGLPDTAYDELDRYGRVTTLVAPNGYHTMGLAPWKARFPDATVHAYGKGAARIAKKFPALKVASFDALPKKLGGSVRVDAIPETRSGEAWMRARGSKGPVWYVGDTFMSMPKEPANFVPRFIFTTLFKSAPGFKANRICLKFLVTDKKAAKQWMLGELRREEPDIVVTGHGDVVSETGLGARMTAMVEEAMPG